MSTEIPTGCLSTALIRVNLLAHAIRAAAGKYRAGEGPKDRHILSISPALAAASLHAQAPPSAQPEAGSPLSAIAQDISTWLSHVTGTATKQHRAASSPPLPRPRPAELAPASVAPTEEPAELAHAPVAPKKKAPLTVLIND